jgi:hypothetical protein
MHGKSGGCRQPSDKRKRHVGILGPALSAITGTEMDSRQFTPAWCSDQRDATRILQKSFEDAMKQSL